MADRPIINHVEMLHRPGEREHARAFFETMGFKVAEFPGFAWLVVIVDADAEPATDNMMYVNEPTPAQLNLQQAFEEALGESPKLRQTLDSYQAIRRRHPQYVFHFGASVPTHEDWQRRTEALQAANEDHPLLKGRIHVKVSEPGMPEALGSLSQAFVYTDVVMCGPVSVAPMLFDLQWAPPDLDLGEINTIKFPDITTMV